MTSWLLNCMSRSMKASIPYTAFTTLSSCCATFRKIRRGPQNPLYINAVKDLAPWIQPLRVHSSHLLRSKSTCNFPANIYIMLYSLTDFHTVRISINFGVFCKLTNQPIYMYIQEHKQKSQHRSLQNTTGHRHPARIM